MRYQCPKCKSDVLSVDVMVTVRLYQHEDNIETQDEGNDHEWNDTSIMMCHGCCYVGEAHEFDTENEE